MAPTWMRAISSVATAMTPRNVSLKFTDVSPAGPRLRAAARLVVGVAPAIDRGGEGVALAVQELPPLTRGIVGLFAPFLGLFGQDSPRFLARRGRQQQRHSRARERPEHEALQRPFPPLPRHLWPCASVS